MSSLLHEKIQLNVRSEFEPLEVVVVHRPGVELDRLTPENVQGFLIEDIPYLKRMQEEHDAFADTMRAAGVRVLYLRDLVADIVALPAARERLVREACDLSHNPAIAAPLLDNLSDAQIVDLLFQGLTDTEYALLCGRDVHHSELHHDRFLLDPSPNSYFTRDPAMVFRDEVISCNAFYSARIRETFLTFAVLELHPYLQGTAFIFGESDREGRPYTIEGGDIIVLNEDAVAVGKSERTRSETIAMLAHKLFQDGRAQRVYEIEIPPSRQYMHLDTVFTIVGPQSVVMFPPVIERAPAIRRYDMLPENETPPLPRSESRTMTEMLTDELGGLLNIIRTGNGDMRYAAREQRSAGSNMLALTPDKVISFDRNIHTNRALREAGVEVLEIPGSELVRGLGGPRCMSMPLRRASS